MTVDHGGGVVVVQQLVQPRVYRVHRVFTDLTHPWVKGYHRNIYVRGFWKYVDVDMDEFKRRGAR